MNLVTGGAGFVGSHLVHTLAARREPVRVLDLPGTDVSHLPRNIAFVPADIRDRAAVRAAVRGCRVVYHLAANPQLWTRRRGDFLAVNYRGAVHVLSEAVAAGVEKVVYCSTESILTRVTQTAPIAEDQVVPERDVIGPYCRSKFFAERYAFLLAAGGAPVIIVNPTLPVGPGDRGGSPPTQLVRDFVRGGRPAYLDADLNLIDVRDAAEGIRLAAAVGRPGRRYLLGAENWSVKRVFDHLADVTGRSRPRWRVPYPVALGVAYFSEFAADVFTHTVPAATVTGVKLTRRRMHFDASKSLTELGLTPRPVAAALTAAAREWTR